MRWAVLVSVAVAAMAVVAGGAGVSPRTSLVEQGYEDVVVGLSSQLDESRADQIIENVKKAVADASQALFKATGNKLFFKKVKILVPSTWNSVTVDQAATNEAFEESHMRVDVRNPVYGDQVYTLQPGGCGDPGRYIHLTPQYLDIQLAENIWGPRGKVIAQAWARLRWGIFDEVGYPGDRRYPLFYHGTDANEQVVVRPNHCADAEVGGKYVDLGTQDPCKYVGNLPDENCRFVPNEQQTATTSLMSFTKLESMNEFCEDGNREVKGHNSQAPNRHNEMCNGRSVWDVLSKHPDFQNATWLPENHPVTPEVLVVQQKAASFALVLDYSGSMSGKKVTVLANTAKRWLLHDVADGSFVTIIKFSDSAVVNKPLTEVSNSTRQALANAITTSATGGTCIGCGLVTALKEMENKSNKVILLITDGGENAKPYIADVMGDVVQAGARVVTISYGKGAEATLETLAQNTGGKAYIVPDDDDGSFMDDAFQGSLTYQPGQSITNTNIKIHEWEGPVQGTGAKTGTFAVDATVGRNLEFRLTTIGATTGTPFITSPSGNKFMDAKYDSNIKLWTIKIENVVAEAGTWTWTMPLQGVTGSVNVKVTVTAQARDPQILPIMTESWMNTGADFVDASQQAVIVYARVTQGENPVVGAKVRAYITTPDTTTQAVELDLLDNGQNADIQAGDGIYSRYFTQILSAGRYAVKAQVWDEGSSFINNGFITSRRRRRRSVEPFSGELVAPEYCCGSVVPFDPKTAVPTGNFTRTVAAGSFHVVIVPAAGDSFPPSPVRDLSIYINDTSSLMLRWTAPGDDYDSGTVFGYEIWMSNDPSALTDDLDLNNTVSLLDFDTSSKMTELLQEAGNEVTFEPNFESSLNPDSLYFFTIRAVDEAGNVSPMSMPVTYTTATITPPSGSVGVSGGLNPWTIVLLAIGCLRGVH